MYEVLDAVLAKHAGTVIVPMTILDPDYFQEIIGRLRARGHDVRHFALLADREIVLRRLRKRCLGQVVGLFAGQDAALRQESFTVSKLDQCLDRLSRPEFAAHLRTDRLKVAQVAESIACSAGPALEPNTDSMQRARLRRAWIGIKHVRYH